MTSKSGNPYDALERVFHEPSRLAILSSLVGTGGKASFSDLKEACDLTDGNLSRHLKTLDDAGVVKMEKSFVGSRPRTTVSLSRKGRTRFLEYLEALERVLEDAAGRVSALKENSKAGKRRSRRAAGLKARLAES